MRQQNKLDTIDGRTLMDRPLEPPNFVVDTLLSQGLHILVGSPKVGKSWLAHVDVRAIQIIPVGIDFIQVSN